MRSVKVFICLLVLVLFITGCTVPGKKVEKKSSGAIQGEIIDNSEQEENEIEEKKAEEKNNYKCTLENSTDGLKASTTLDITYNTSDGYASKIFTTIIYDYNITVTDELFKTAVEIIEPNACEKVDCTQTKVNLGETESGLDNVIRRQDKRITINYYNLIGEGQTVTEKGKEDSIDALKNLGYTCE